MHFVQDVLRFNEDIFESLFLVVEDDLEHAHTHSKIC
jgi:hypothetical protein